MSFFSSTGSSQASSPSPGWTLESFATPTHFFSSPAEDTECFNTLGQKENVGSPSPVCDAYNVFATNAGSEPTRAASPVTLTDTLPQGVTAPGVELFLVENGNTTRDSGTIIGGKTVPAHEAGTVECSTTPSVRCTFTAFSGGVPPNDELEMIVYVTVNEGVAEGTRLTNKAEVSGGGAPTVSTEASNVVGAAPAAFAPAGFGFYKDALNGSEETQAGGHPYELTTTIDLDNELRNEPTSGRGKEQGVPASVEDLKDVVVDLPLGFAGSTLAAPQCTEAQLDSEAHCPPDTVVGHLTTEPNGFGTTITGPIWNIAPEHGHPAEFGYIDTLKAAHIAGYVSVVPTPAGYVLRFVASDIPELNISRIVVTFYGDPAAEQAETAGRGETPATNVPFFTNPTDCSGSPQVAKLWIDSWSNPAKFQPGSDGLIPANLKEEQWKEAVSESPPVTGCNALQFTPAIGSQPTTHEADSPSGLEFEQRLPQSEIFGTNATPALKDTTIVFPQGMTVDPSSADGLGTCSDAQIGYESNLPNPTLFDFTQAPPECPESSKIGSVELETPLIPGTLHGEVFLAAQNENPFHSTFATYIVVNDPVTGVVLKLAGELKSDPATGQLTAVFDETPQLPFSNLKVHFFGGPRAELATPPNCGTYTTNSELTPWSAPGSGPNGTPFDNYEINQNCAIGFDPRFTALSTNVQAGAYTTFQASFAREDDDQELAGAEISLPPGLLANITSVTECGAAEIAAEAADAPTGGCPASSKVGTVQAGAGPGPNPLFVGGNVFFTGPYNGGPFGLAVVVSANPGPFHFGNVLVRQSLRINPETAAVTDVSDPFPTFLDPVGPNGQTTGIPIKLRRVDVQINRPGFTFNPTSCSKTQVGGTITSTQGATSSLAVPFQVTACERLKFAPKFAVSTAAHTSKALGASLTAKVTIPSGAQGTYSDIARVKVDLPIQLPSQLKTLQKACPAKVFEEGFEHCLTKQYEDSKVGEAVVHTPILGTPLSGPAIFVSHGGEAFPSLTIVLQGDGITIDLVGSTFIHGGITSTTFKTVPDTPFSTFELTIPQGKYAALAANLPEKDHGNLCGQNLKMPTEFLAQNGAKINEDTQIAITGCAKVKALTRAQKLQKALKACRSKDKRNKGKRQTCETAARKRYGAVKKKGRK